MKIFENTIFQISFVIFIALACASIYCLGIYAIHIFLETGFSKVLALQGYNLFLIILIFTGIFFLHGNDSPETEKSKTNGK